MFVLKKFSGLLVYGFHCGLDFICPLFEFFFGNGFGDDERGRCDGDDAGEGFGDDEICPASSDRPVAFAEEGCWNDGLACFGGEEGAACFHFATGAAGAIWGEDEVRVFSFVHEKADGCSSARRG